MSSPHLGGDYLNAMAAAKANGTGSRGGSGRSTPVGPHGMANSPLRSIPAQLAYARPQAITTHQQHGSDDEEDGDGTNRGIGWRPITPSRASPRNGGAGTIQDTPKMNALQRGPSSRTTNEDLQLHVHEPQDDEHPHDTSASLDQSTNGASENSAGSPEARFSTLPPVLKGYLLGQIACVVKFGVWWVGFTYLILALFGGSSYLVGGTRICFNLALLLCSPMAGGIAEKTNIKKLLNKTVIVRGLIYCLAIPVAWTLLESGLLWSETHSLHVSFFVVFLLIIFIDGIGVSFSNVADIDSGGVNLVAAQYGIEIDDNIRNYFNSLHIMFFDLSMVIFNPILAYMGLLVGQHTVSNSDGRAGEVVDELTLLIAIGGVFLISTLMTLICYNSYMPEVPPQPSSEQSMNQSMQNFSAPGGVDESNISMNSSPSATIAVAEPDPLSWAQFKELASSVREGAVLTWQNTRIRWRVLFFAVETSVEDAMIALIAAEIGSLVFAPGDSKLQYSYGNLWGAGLVACGKSGGVLASVLMHRYFKVDPASESSAYRPLFWFAFLGGVCSLLLPLSYHFRVNGSISTTISTVLMFLAMFLFFLFSTLSKIGFSTLMQSMAAEVEATGRVFGFVAAFVTATDALILMGMAALFSAVGLQLALWISCAFIATHGLIELIFGPGLVLKPSSPSLDEQLKQDLVQPLM